MEGIAKGAGMSYKEIFTYNNFQGISGCTNIFFQNSDHGPLLAQNLECDKEEYEQILVREVYPEKGIPFIAATIAGMVWVWSNCINKYGLSLASVSSHHKGYLTKDGAVTGIIQRYAMQYSEDVNSFFSIAKNHRYVGKIGIWMVADEKGKCLRIEIDNRNYFSIPVDRFGFNTGLYHSPIEAQNEPLFIKLNKEKENTIKILYKENKIEFTLKGMKKLLSYHTSPGPVCRHSPWDEVGEETRSSRIMIPQERKMLITYGPPCKSPFTEFSFENEEKKDGYKTLNT
ncbi:MAG: C45 family autoproteolytic acyltransferase/hydrolase [Candidatus Omnitrophica bacterium]|nr:C45 family autoproteolytic acyltransferase/hydrolase [Candidatus Omnitrophota bacterium]